MSDDDFNQDSRTKASPLKVILLIAVLIVIAGAAYVFVNRAAVQMGDTPNMPNAIEGMMDEANPFPETKELNLPPQDEMVDDAPDGASAPATDADITAAASSFDIEKALGTRSIGDPNAPVKLQEYFSLTCNHCANFHNITLPQIKGYIDRGEVYLEFHEFPLNAPALRASMVARCLPEDKYYGFITMLFKTQDTWMSRADYAEQLRKNAKLAGMNDAEFDACFSNNELQQALGENIQKATAKWQIESTPTFVVNDGKEMIKGAQPAYEFERVFRAVTDGKVAPLIKDQQETE